MFFIVYIELLGASAIFRMTIRYKNQRNAYNDVYIPIYTVSVILYGIKILIMYSLRTKLKFLNNLL